MNPSRMEIRKLKYGDYIERNPHKPYGYYAMGELSLMEQNVEDAITCYMKALSLERSYARAKIGYLICLIQLGKYRKALRFFEKKCDDVKKKDIFMKDLLFAISTENAVSNPNFHTEKAARSIDLKKKTKRLLRRYKTRKNVLAGLLVLLHFYREKTEWPAKDLFDLYESFVYKKGINPYLRYHITEQLTNMDEQFGQDEAIASLFTFIPVQSVTSSYANTILSVYLKQQPLERINKALKSILESHLCIDRQNMWHYVYISHQQTHYSATTLRFCKNLMKDGWVDSIVANAFRAMQRMNMSGIGAHDDKMLALYGYDAPI